MASASVRGDIICLELSSVLTKILQTELAVFRNTSPNLEGRTEQSLSRDELRLSLLQHLYNVLDEVLARDGGRVIRDFSGREW